MKSILFKISHLSEWLIGAFIILTSVCLNCAWASPLRSSPNKCAVFYGVRMPKIYFGQMYLEPVNVVPQISQSIAEVYMEGPNRWVSAGPEDVSLNRYQRGLSGGYFWTGGGAQEAIRLLTGQQSRKSHSVYMIPKSFKDPVGWRSLFDNENKKRARVSEQEKSDEAARLYAYPLAIRGRTDRELSFPRSGAKHFMERKIESGVSVVSQVSELGLFYLNVTFRNPEYAMTWATEYIELSNFLFSGGMQIPRSSRGYQFYSEINAALDKVDPHLKRMYQNLRDATSFDSITQNPYKQPFLNYFKGHPDAMNEIIEILNRYAAGI